MNTPSRNSLLLALGLLAFVVLGFNLTMTKAQTNTLEDKMNQLMDVLIKKESIEASRAQLEPSDDLLIEGDPLLSGTGSPAGRCTDNYTTWPTSDVYKESPWENHFIQPDRVSGSNDTRESSSFIDANGDGLIDYLYNYWSNGFGGSNSIYGCVMLNNGAGWEPAYRCRMTRPDNVTPWTFWGDCADTGA